MKTRRKTQSISLHIFSDKDLRDLITKMILDMMRPKPKAKTNEPAEKRSGITFINSMTAMITAEGKIHVMIFATVFELLFLFSTLSISYPRTPFKTTDQERSVVLL